MCRKIINDINNAFVSPVQITYRMKTTSAMFSVQLVTVKIILHFMLDSLHCLCQLSVHQYVTLLSSTNRDHISKICL